MSLQNLLGVDELGVEWSSGYPGARTRLRDDIVCMHGEKLNAKDQASKTPYLFHTIFGHVHSAEMQSKTYEDNDGSQRNFLHMTPGCLCRITGEVPGFNSSSDHLGRPLKTTQNWQQGIMAITYSEEVGTPIGVTQYPINDGACLVEGRMLKSDPAQEELFHQTALVSARTFTR